MNSAWHTRSSREGASRIYRYTGLALLLIGCILFFVPEPLLSASTKEFIHFLGRIQFALVSTIGGIALLIPGEWRRLTRAFMGAFACVWWAFACAYPFITPSESAPLITGIIVWTALAAMITEEALDYWDECKAIEAIEE